MDLDRLKEIIDDFEAHQEEQAKDMLESWWRMLAKGLAIALILAM